MPFVLAIVLAAAGRTIASISTRQWKIVSPDRPRTSSIVLSRAMPQAAHRAAGYPYHMSILVAPGTFRPGDCRIDTTTYCEGRTREKEITSQLAWVGRSPAAPARQLATGPRASGTALLKRAAATGTTAGTLHHRDLVLGPHGQQPCGGPIAVASE